MKTNIFNHLSVNSDNLLARMEESLAAKQLQVSIFWTKGAPLLIYRLNYRLKNGNWSDALHGTAAKETDGEFSVILKSFEPGDQVEVSFGLKAFTNIPRIVIAASQTNPDQVLKRIPEEDYKNLDDNDAWEERFIVTIK